MQLKSPNRELYPAPPPKDESGVTSINVWPIFNTSVRNTQNNENESNTDQT